MSFSRDDTATKSCKNLKFKKSISKFNCFSILKRFHGMEVRASETPTMYESEMQIKKIRKSATFEKKVTLITFGPPYITTFKSFILLYFTNNYFITIPVGYFSFMN